VSKVGQIRIGTSGWVYKHWRHIFYPDKLAARQWFSYYQRYFNTVEINYSFYRLPLAETFRNWQRQAAPGFLYAVKASRFLTHRKKLTNPEEPLDNIITRVRLLGSHHGPILYQLPPRWRCDAPRLRDFIEMLPKDLFHVFEFRDPRWYCDEVRHLLTRNRMSLCIHDSRVAPSPLWLTGPIVYLRFHSPIDPQYAGRYPRRHLAAWAEHIERMRQSGHDVYVYFNNDGGGHAVTNGRELQTMLGLAPDKFAQSEELTLFHAKRLDPRATA
jgi:uncharacterized protein YecE (DUF72 family)